MKPTAGSNRRRGFTLIELLVAIAILVILMTVGIPNFQGLMTHRRVDTEYFQVLAALRYARAEAIKRRVVVTAVIMPDEDGAGWRLEVKNDDGSSLGTIDCANSSDSKCLLVRNYNDSRTTLTTTSTILTFNPIGRLVSSGGEVAMSINYGGSSRGVCIALSGNVLGKSCA